LHEDEHLENNGVLVGESFSVIVFL
jgi:hypothetical protein